MQSAGKQVKTQYQAKTSVLSVLSLLESFVLALILAFIFRGFVVEAFVIPTGSMAQSLMGMHYQSICRDCRYQYTTGLISRGGNGQPRGYQAGARLRCPNCGDSSVTLSDRSILPRAGDRVLVLKPMYFLSRYKYLEWLGPKRWEVVVFLYPGNGQDNYIKRLAGLPGESIEVIDGDVYIDGQIKRKPDRVQQGLWITLLDNDYQLRREDDDWPLWRAVDGKIDRLQQGQVLRLKALGTGQTITYRGSTTNSLGYNALRRSAKGNAIVSDLRLSFDAIARRLGRAAEITAVLSRQGRHFRMRLLLSEAKTVLELQSRYASPADQGQTHWRTLQGDYGAALRRELGPIAQGKSLHLQIQNVDYRVSISLDGKQILATTDSNYKPPPLNQLRDLAATRGPKPYVAISSKDCEVDLLHIKLDRDVYYTSPQQIRVPTTEKARDPLAARLDGQPGHAVGKPFRIPPRGGRPEPAYFMFGDNSSDSQDSRLWWGKHSGLDDSYVRGTVPQSHMIGQAFFVYWPSGGPILGRQLPFIPRVGKMRLIR